jgi:hypothetical protein
MPKAYSSNFFATTVPKFHDIHQCYRKEHHTTGDRITHELTIGVGEKIYQKKERKSANEKA